MDKSYHLESRCRTGFSWPLQITALYLSFLCRYPGSLWDFLVLWGPFQISGHILLLLWPLSDDKLHPLWHNSPLSSENARYHLGRWPADGSASYLLYLVIQSRKLWTLCKNYLFVIRWNGFFFSEIKFLLKILLEKSRCLNYDYSCGVCYKLHMASFQQQIHLKSVHNPHFRGCFLKSPTLTGI